MKILHTSDWHIGKLLHKKKRHEEFDQFFTWLAGVIEKERIDALLVAGDVFDTTTPSNHSLELYYSFLGRIAHTGCRHCVITAGNHDSPSLLNAPKDILRFLNIHIIGCVTNSIADEVITLRDSEGKPELIVCAVPYLRDGDIRLSEEGETPDAKIHKTLDGIRDHYARVVALAETTRAGLHAEIPIVAMGHLFAAGGRTIEGDGVRELYVGSLAYVNAEVFPPCLDYVALGHLHVPQMMGGLETRRYSGSPIPMGFGEAEQEKCIVVVETGNGHPVVTSIAVPCFQKLKQVRGSWKEISHQIKMLIEADAPCWLEIVYDGTDIVGNLQEHIDALIIDTKLTVLTTMDLRRTQAMLAGFDASVSLEELTEEEIFLRCLDARNIAEEHRAGLIDTFREAVAHLQQHDARAE